MQNVNLMQSTLEMYVEVLKVLAGQIPLTVEHIMPKLTVDCNTLEQELDFLFKEGLVAKSDKNEPEYSISQKGLKVLTFFSEKG